MMSTNDHQNGTFQQAGNSIGDAGSPNPLADVINETSSKSENTGQTTTSSADDHDKKSKKLRGIEVFVGDISFFCKEVDLYKLFSNYGRVMRTRIKRSDKNGRTLMYGFVDMERLEDAKESIKALHQSRFQGRDIRVELSGSRAPTQPARPNHENYPQIYISFRSDEGNPEGDQLPTESFLREIFEKYSAVKDIAIKEYSYDKTTHTQHGFCFAAFLNLPDAKRVFSTIHGHVHRGFLFSCSVSYHFPLDDDVMTATAAVSCQRERGSTPSSGVNSPRDTNMVSSNHYGRRPLSNPNDSMRKMSGDVAPMMYPQSYVPYGGNPMMTGYTDMVGMTSMYPTMHVMPPIYPMPPHMSSSDGSYMPMQVPIVPPLQSTYPPSGPSPTPHGYMLPSQQTGLFYSASPTSSLPNTPRDGRTSYYGPPAQMPTPPAPYHHNNNHTNSTTSTTVSSSSPSSSLSTTPLLSQQMSSFHNVGVGKLEENPKSATAMHSHQPQLDYPYMNNKANEIQQQQHQRSTSFNHNNQHRHHHSASNNHNSNHMNMSSSNNALPANNVYPQHHQHQQLHAHNQPQSQQQAPYYSMNDQFTGHQNSSNHSHHSHSHISNHSPHHHNVNANINASNSHHHQESSNSTATTVNNTASFSAQPHYSSLSTPFFMPDRM